MRPRMACSAARRASSGALFGLGEVAEDDVGGGAVVVAGEEFGGGVSWRDGRRGRGRAA